MPILKTKDGDARVELATVLHLVVPPQFANPQVILSKNKFRVEYWDPVTLRKTSRTFENNGDAIALKSKMTWDRSILLRDMTVKDILDNYRFVVKHYRLAPHAIEYSAQDVPVPSRWIGMWLGDGTSCRCEITTANPEIVSYVMYLAASYGLNVYHNAKYKYCMTAGHDRGVTKRVPQDVAIAVIEDVVGGMSKTAAAHKHGIGQHAVKKYMDLHACGGIDEYYRNAAAKQNPITIAMKELGIWRNKHIPKCYLENTRAERLELLAGFIDTDAHYKDGGYDIILSSKRLLMDIVTLARSLGFLARDPKQTIKVCTNALNGPKECTAFKSRVCGGNELMEIPVLLEYKACLPRQRRRDQLAFEIVPDEN